MVTTTLQTGLAYLRATAVLYNGPAALVCNKLASHVFTNSFTVFSALVLSNCVVCPTSKPSLSKCSALVSTILSIQGLQIKLMVLDSYGLSNAC